MSKRVCILGGSFNPIHMGHLHMAQAAQKHCQPDEVWFLPAGQPWQKANVKMASAQHRRRMVELAIQHTPNWRLEPLELEQQGPSYTVDTLKILHKQHPDHHFILLIGADQLANLCTWKDWEQLFVLTEIGVVQRPHWGTMNFPAALMPYMHQQCLFSIPMNGIDISSTQIRASLSAIPRATSICLETTKQTLENKLPERVLQYLLENSIY